MTYPTKVVEIISMLKLFLTHESTKLNFRTNSSDFSRASGKLDFYTYALLGLSLVKNSLAIEVYNLLTTNDLPFISKSAYSQARYKIKYCFYQFLTTFLMELIYGSRHVSKKGVSSGLLLKKWRGYYLEAIDGTGLQLPQTKELGAYFGYHKHGTGRKRKLRTVMAKCLVRVDLLNEYVLQSEVFETFQSERTICKKWLYQLHSTSITIFDRGFCSAPIFSYLVKYNKPFVARLPVGFNKVVKAFMEEESNDKEVDFKINKAEVFSTLEQENASYSSSTQGSICIEKGSLVQLRLVKVLLPNGQIEVLATNLMDEKTISIADLSDLYRQRWGVETILDSVKNQLLLTVFSGLKPQAILQDVYATFFIYNLRQLLINESQEIVNQKAQESKKCTHKQKVNKNVALGILKPKIMTLFLVHQPEKIIEELIQCFARNKLSVVENKVRPPRKKNIAKRRNLVTQKNYKKAI